MTASQDIPEPESYSEPEKVEYEVIPLPEPEPPNPSKTGNKPKQLKAIEVFGYEVGRGLRKRIVNPEDVYKLAQIGCTDREIAIWFDVAEDTLRYNFAEVMLKGREDLRAALRTAMIRNAINNNNAALQIFLAKNMLNMSDNPTAREDDRPLPWQDD